MTTFHTQKLIRRCLGTLFIIGVISMISLSMTTDVMGQSITTANFGTGRGHGLEIGINLDAVNSVKAQIAAGVYDRQCTAAEHDVTKWHTLVNVEAKCHFDHHHGDDPNYVNDIFGEPGAWFGSVGQSVSYPWQTFKATTANEPNDAFVANKQMENNLKHEGYIWVVRRDQQCPDGACTTDFRLQFHGIFGAHDAVVRWHSFSYEGRVCQNPADPTTCGIVRHGGWMDFGRLFVTPPDVVDCEHNVQEIYIPLSADTLYRPVERPESRDEVRCHPTVVTVPKQTPTRQVMEWWGLQSGRFRAQIRSYDPIGNINPQAPDEWSFYCTQDDMNCVMNQTTTTVFIGYTHSIPEFVDYCEFGCINIDSNGDQKGDFKGYTDRLGGLVQNCTAPGLDCVPLEYNNVTLNLYNNKEARYNHTVCQECPKLDYDFSPAGKRWNNWFFTKYVNGGGHGEVTPVPTTPPTEPTAVPTTLPTGAAVIVEVTPATAAPGETVNVAFKLSNVANVYGLQAICQVDPAIITGAARTNGEAFVDGSSFTIDSGYQPDGKWTVASSLLQPAAPISGSLTAFTLSYNVLSAGEDNLACEVLAVDQNGAALAIEVVNGQLSTVPTPQVPTTEPTVEPSVVPTIAVPDMTLEPGVVSVVSGSAAYQNRPDNAGILARLFSVDMGQIGEPITTDASGAFSFADVPAGQYKLLLVAPQHIPAIVDVVVANDGMAVNTGTATLASGDTDDNGSVDVLDATFIGANFGVDTPPAPANADLNADLTVNITDLVLVGGNFGAASPMADGQ